MNIIDAWQKAKEGDIIFSKEDDWELKKTTGKLSKILLGYSDSFICRPDWEVKRIPLVWEGEVKWENYGLPYALTIRDDIMKFIGKRVKIRIEEIIE